MLTAAFVTATGKRCPATAEQRHCDGPSPRRSPCIMTFSLVFQSAQYLCTRNSFGHAGGFCRAA